MASFKAKGSSKVDFSKSIDLSNLKGKTALITGGASGLGAAFATTLAQNGCNVTIVDLNAELGARFIEEQKNQGLNITFAQADVTSYPSLLSAFKTAISSSPTSTIDIVIPSAGLFGPPINALLPDPSSPDDPPEPSTAVLDVNMKGVYLTTYLALHYFRQSHAKQSTPTTNKGPPAAVGEKQEKQILLLSTILAYLEAPLNLSYCSSKHGVRGLFRSLRWEGEELAIPGLRVNMIAPTLAKTPMTRDFWSYLQDVRGFAMSLPEEIVEVGMRLLSDTQADGRAVGVIPCGRDGKGSEAVDLEDDFEGLDGGRVSLDLIKKGVLGEGPSASGRFIV